MDGQKGCNVHSSISHFLIKVCILLGNTQETNVLVMKVKMLSFYWDVNFLFGYDKPNIMKLENVTFCGKTYTNVPLNGLFHLIRKSPFPLHHIPVLANHCNYC